MLTSTARAGAQPRRCRGDEGSALMLMPAAMLIMVILGAIAADMSHVHMNKRELLATANSLANDAATYGVDPDQLRRAGAGAYPLDAGRVREHVNRALTRERDVRLVDIVVGDPRPADGVAGTVSITLAKRVDYIFAKAIPGADDFQEVRADGIAEAREER